MATKLAKLRIDEVSGVDEPANDSQDWIVMKSKTVLKEIEQAEDDAGQLYELLQKDEVFSGAPEGVQKAREELSDHLDDILEEDDGEGPQTTSTVKSRLRAIFGVEKSAEEDAEETDDTEDEADDAVDAKQQKRDAVAKSEEDSEEDDSDEEDSDEEEETDSVDKADDDSADEEVSDEDDSDEAVDAVDENGVAKSTDGTEEVLKELLDSNELFREAVLNLADRVESLEGSGGRSSLYGQEAAVEKKAPTLTDAINAATRGNRVTLR